MSVFKSEKRSEEELAARSAAVFDLRSPRAKVSFIFGLCDVCLTKCSS